MEAASTKEIPLHAPEIDPSRPTTKIQIRMTDGSKIVGHFNAHHTVADVIAFVRSKAPGKPVNGLLDVASRRVLDNFSASIEQEQLLNKVVSVL